MTADECKLTYLKEAAYLLAITSPTVSATLGTARDRLRETTVANPEAPTKEWEAIRRVSCGACGNVMMPGWSCEVILDNGLQRPVQTRPKDTSKPQSRRKTLRLCCLRCNRETVQPIQFGGSRRARRAHKVQATSDPAKATKSANASSKQRAKARKGGLQAMLAQSKSQPSQQQGLDLMDFMQQKS